jgi:hypothetical protein
MTDDRTEYERQHELVVKVAEDMYYANPSLRAFKLFVSESMARGFHAGLAHADDREISCV